ncbi:unnamed protein product, partial [Timema podura]|nr:unnamed protein product [Timema podura]
MLSMLAVLGLLMLDVVIYGMITCYLETVVSGRYGLSKPWYFCCMPSYWKSRDTELGIEHTTTGNGNEKNFETPPVGLEVGIRLKDIRKLFHSFT